MQRMASPKKDYFAQFFVMIGRTVDDYTYHHSKNADYQSVLPMSKQLHLAVLLIMEDLKLLLEVYGNT